MLAAGTAVVLIDALIYSSNVCCSTIVQSIAQECYTKILNGESLMFGATTGTCRMLHWRARDAQCGMSFSVSDLQSPLMFHSSLTRMFS
jgi:hypothetical protein